jgi:cytochrome c
MRRGLFGFCLVTIAAVLLWGQRGRTVEASQDEEAAKPEFYAARVKPILEANCYRCHAGMNRRGGLSMATRAGLMKGGKDGAVIVPGDPQKSLMVTSLRQQAEGRNPMAMPPPPRARLSESEVATIERWIRAGAVMPNDAPPE